MSEREEIIRIWKEKRRENQVLRAVGAGKDLAGLCQQADLAMLLYEALPGDLSRWGGVSSLLAYGDANEALKDLRKEVLSSLKGEALLLGVCGSDPFRSMKHFLMELKDEGYAGVSNFPTLALIDGTFRNYLEEMSLGYGLEVEMIRQAHALDLLTLAYVFDVDQARAMAEAGADVLVAHMGLKTHGPIGQEKDLHPGDCIPKLKDIMEAGRAVNPDMLFLFCGGPILSEEDAVNVMAELPLLDGFFEMK